MKIDVKTLPVQDIIKDIANFLKVEVAEDSGEQTIRLPSEVGEGYIRGTSFESGMGIIAYNCKFFEDTEICFTLNTVHPLKFIFCSEGDIAHSFQEDDELHKIEAYQNIIVSSSGYNGHVLYFKANVRAYVSSLEIIRATFSHRDNYQFRDLDPVLIDIFKDEVSKHQFFYQGNYSIKAADIMEEMNTKEYTGFLRNVFLESKSFHMLVIQISQYQDDEDEDRLPQILRKSDIQKVDYVAKRVIG
ncbi:MAG: AraC family transcriptional regulator, partial [Gillisia sp.]